MTAPTALDNLGVAAVALADAAADIAKLANVEDDALCAQSVLLLQEAQHRLHFGQCTYLLRLAQWATELSPAGTAPVEEGIEMAAANPTPSDPLAALTARQAAIHAQHAAAQAELAALRERRATFRASVAVLEPAGREAQGIEQTEAEIAAAERRLSRFDAALAEVAAELAEETARAEAERRAGLARQRDALLAKRAPLFDAMAELLTRFREQVQTGLALSQQIAALDAALGESYHQPLGPGHVQTEYAAFALDVACTSKAVLGGIVGGFVNAGVEPLPADAPITFAATRG